MVLEPLVLESREELEEKIPQWKATLERLDSPESEKRHLRELLTYAIVEKFSKLTREEIEKMLKLTPLDETVCIKAGGAKMSKVRLDSIHDPLISRGIQCQR